MIGGLTGSTLITLVLIPAVYTLFHPETKASEVRGIPLWQIAVCF